MAAEISIWTLNFFKLLSNQINIWCQFTVVALYIRQPPFSKYQNSDLKNNLKFTCCFEKSRKNSSSNLYFHPDTFDLIYKFFLICCHFLLVAQYIRQHQLLAISVSQKQCQIYLLLRKSTKSNCNNLYLKNKPFKINLKTNSYLTSFFCSDSVNPSILTFLNISLTKAVR